MKVEISGNEVVVDAGMLAPLLQLEARDVPDMMRRQEITSRCERGTEEDEGRYRLTFFHGRRCVRFKVDAAGKVLQYSSIVFAA